MTQPAIKVQGVSKEYIIGRHQKGQDTFRELVAGAVAAPFRRRRKMRVGWPAQAGLQRRVAAESAMRAFAVVIWRQ